VVLASLLLAGCGEAKRNPDLRVEEALERGTPFVDVLKKHGCPDSVAEIDSDTFTASWSRSRIVAAAPFYSRHEHRTLTYPVRRGKVGQAKTSDEGSSSEVGVGYGSDARGSLEVAGGLGLLPLFAVVLAWQLGRRFREQARRELLPAAFVAVLLLGTSWSHEQSGVAGSDVPEASHVNHLVEELGAPARVLRLPGDLGTVLVYERRESRQVIVGGSEQAQAQAYLVQNAKVVAESPRLTTLEAQYWLFPFFETARARLHAVIGWSVALGVLALGLATRRKKTPAPAA
jgi:hypothetical protein